MNEISNNESKNKNGRTESFMKRFFNKTPKNIFGLFIIFTLIILGSLIFTNKANAATYYVALTGSDSNTAVQAQSTSTPWATVEYAIENGGIHFGDTIILRGGTYDAANLWKSGSNKSIGSSYMITTPASGTVTIKAYTGESVTVNIPSDSLNPLFSLQGDFLIKGINFTNTHSVVGAFFNIGSQNDRATHLSFEDCTFDNNNVLFYPIWISSNYTNFDASVTITRCKVRNIVATSSWSFIGNMIAGGHTATITIQSSLFRNMGYIVNSPSPLNLTFTNNTIANLTQNSTFYGLTNSGTKLIANNIFRADSTFKYPLNVSAAINANWTIKNNIFYRPVTADPSGDLDYFSNAAVGTELFPLDETNLYINPQFTNEAGDDYTLSSASLVSGRGNATYLPSGGDIIGTTWTGVDIGCYANPSAIASFPSITDGTVAFIGDSLAEGAGNRAVTDGRFTVVGTGLQGAAIGGSQLMGAKWFVDRAAVTWHPKTIFIITANNAFTGVYNSPTNMTYPQATSEIETIFKKAQYWGMTPIWLGMGGNAGVDPTTKPIALNSAVQSMCNSNGYNCGSWLSYMMTINPTNWNKAISQGGYYQESPTGPLSNNVHPDSAVGDDIILNLAEYLYYTKGIVGTNRINIGAGARIYKDGNFRNLNATSGATANLSVTPQSGTFTSGDYSRWLDITNITNWTNSHKTWTESNAQTSNIITNHTIGDLEANKYYNITVTDASPSTITGINGTTCNVVDTNAICKSNGSGELSFQYTGGYSTHTFDMQENTDTVSTPIATPIAGIYNSTQSVALSAVGSNYIKYDLSSIPTDCSSSTSYVGPISVETSQTIYVRACNNVESSSTATFAYTIDTSVPLTPVATPSSGIFNSTQSITLTATGSDSIRYSTSTTPTDCSAGTLYSDSTPIVVSSTQTIYVRACDLANNSSTGSFAYTIDTTPPETPTATPSTGSFNSTQSVTLNSVGSDYIKYDTSVVANCSAGISYGGPISIPSSETIYALACDNAGNSTATSFDYIIDSETPSTAVVTPVAGTYTTTQSITITSAGSDSIRYSLTETPTDCSSGTLYENPIQVSTTQTLYVRACDTLNNSSTASFAYVINIHTSSGSSSGGSYVATPPPTQEPSDLEKTLAMIEKYKAQQSNSPVTLLPIIRILKLTTPRMWGDDVLVLQTYLNTKGYNSGTPDGNFGPKTQSAVIAFQKANGLVPDGSVGPNTLNYLNGNQTITTSPATIQPTVTRILKLLVPRMIGDDVLNLQTYLNTNGYDVGNLDGVLGTKTRTAVIAFQTANSLTPDGIVGAKTLEMMK